jgi:Ferritin-like domain
MSGHTRRELILRGAVAGLGGAGVAARSPTALAATPAGDAGELRSLVIVEQLIAFTYGHVLEMAALSPPAASSLRSFLAHEREHVRLLSAALVRLGEAPPAPPSDVEAASRELARLNVPGSLQAVKSQDDALHYLIGVETLAEGAYYSSMSRLSDQRALVLAAQVMSCEAQHWTALSGLLHAGDVYRAVPYPVVLG